MNLVGMAFERNQHWPVPAVKWDWLEWKWDLIWDRMWDQVQHTLAGSALKIVEYVLVFC